MSPHRHAVFGHPVAHSLSPRIHALFGRQLGIGVDYRAIDAPPERFADQLAAFAERGGCGANVTLPLKELAHGLCASLSPFAQRAGAVNTLVRQGEGWHGENTDGSGFLADLRGRHGLEPRGASVLLLGAGGAARAVAFALVDAGVARLVICNRTRARAESLAEALESPAVEVLKLDQAPCAGGFALVVNASAAGHAGTGVALPAGLFAADALAYDLSYGPAAEGFLAAAAKGGAARVADGLGMLVEQAADAFAHWHGRRPDTASVHAALASGG